MRFGAEEIQQHADSLGFPPDSLEKVFRLLSLLDALRSSAFLRPRVALNCGTALNLFFFDVPRLSVDIDFNQLPVEGFSQDVALDLRAGHEFDGDRLPLVSRIDRSMDFGHAPLRGSASTRTKRSARNLISRPSRILHGLFDQVVDRLRQ